MEQKKQKSFPIGRIVKVINGMTFGNKANTITKVLAKSGVVSDGETGIGVRNGKHMLLQLCENVTSNTHATYNNKQCFYEHVDDLILATTEEKKLYHKNKKSNNEKNS